VSCISARAKNSCPARPTPLHRQDLTASRAEPLSGFLELVVLRIDHHVETVLGD